MKCRTVLVDIGLAFTLSSAGCLNRVPGIGIDTEFKEVEAELRVEDPPNVTVDGDTVLVQGTVQYGSSSCGMVELAHAAYEDSQDRLDLLIVAADDSNGLGGCTEDLVEMGYRVEATTNDDLRCIAVTEHHVFGETYSTTVDLTNW